MTKGFIIICATNTGVVECSKHYRHIIMNPLVIATNTGEIECSKHYRHIIMNSLVPVFVAMTKGFIIMCL
jgi:RNase P/RNase MRP subunit POP5